MKTLLNLLAVSLLIVTPHFAHARQGAAHHGIDPDTAYKNNCTRCHSSVQQYSPQMTKTIIMHMRVRANLPEDTAQAILEYLNGSSEARPTARENKPVDNNKPQK